MNHRLGAFYISFSLKKKKARKHGKLYENLSLKLTLKNNIKEAFTENYT